MPFVNPDTVAVVAPDVVVVVPPGVAVTVYWVMGGGLSAQAGGRVVGEQVAVTQDRLFQNRDYPVLNEYRAVFGGLFRRMYGLSPAQLGQVFDGVAPKDLSLV